ncbi:hypothetical protein P5V15_000313 [Pogonomyrmex californicus]
MSELKAFYVDLLVPLETNLEKDTKVVQVSKPPKMWSPEGTLIVPAFRLLAMMNNATRWERAFRASKRSFFSSTRPDPRPIARRPRP